MEKQHTNTRTTTFLTDYFKELGDLMIEHILYGEKPKDIWVDCEVKDVTPCEECQEFDCYGCEYKEVKGRHE